MVTVFSIAAMLPLDLSYVAILRDVACHCCLPYVSCIREVVQDGSYIYGIEIELTPDVVQGTSRTLFFWADPAIDHALAYEAAALQALIALQTIYGLMALHRGIHGFQLYRFLAHRLFPVANRGAQLARLVVAAAHHQNIPLSALVTCAQQLLDEVTSIPHDCGL